MKELKSLNKVSDFELASFVRQGAAILMTEDDAEKSVMISCANMAMVLMVLEINSNTTTANFEELEYKGEKLGNWRLTIQRLDDNMKPIE